MASDRTPPEGPSETPLLEGERTIAGLSCSQILGALDAYLDGSLPADLRPSVEAHVRGCEQCERFGSAYARVAQRVRGVTAETPASVEILERLRARLRRAIDG